MIISTISYQRKFLGQLVIYHGIKAGGLKFEPYIIGNKVRFNWNLPLMVLKVR